MGFTPNDYVTVTLSSRGADLLNKDADRMNAKYGHVHRWKADHKQGDALRGQFWSIIGKFEGCFKAGAEMPFTDMVLHKEANQ